MPFTVFNSRPFFSLMTRLPHRRLFAFTLIAILIQLTPGFAAEPAPSSITDAVIWKFATGKEVTAAPVIDQGVVYCGSTNGQFFALDAATGQQLWKFKARFPISCHAAVQGDTVCFESGNTLHALDRTTGREKWQYVAKAFRPIHAMDLTDYHRSSPVIADGVVYFGDDWGNLNGVDLASGSLTFQFTTEAARPIRSSPAIKNGIVYFGDWEGDVFAVSLADKKTLWKHRLENTRPYYGAVVSEFLIQDNVLYFGSQHDSFTPLDLATGKPVWHYTDPKHTYLPSTPLLHNGNVIIGTTIRANAILCLNQGNLVWSFPVDGIFFTRPIVHESTLIMNSTNFGKTGWLYLLDINNGRLINKIAIEKATPSAPALSESRVFLGAGDGCIYALSLAKLRQPKTP